MTQECYDEPRHYVYRHIRLDKNEPFYIGVGTKDFKKYKEDNLYLRAKVNHFHNKIWTRIVLKTDYRVEILLEFDDINDAFNKEIELIALYKRKVDGGILANLSLGGKNSFSGSARPPYSKEQLEELSRRMKELTILRGGFFTGRKHSNETKKLIGEKSKGRKHTEENKKLISEAAKLVNKQYCSKIVLHLETGIFYNSAKEAYNSIPRNYSYRVFVNRLNPKQNIKNNTSYIYVDF